MLRSDLLYETLDAGCHVMRQQISTYLRENINETACFTTYFQILLEKFIRARKYVDHFLLLFLNLGEWCKSAGNLVFVQFVF